MQKGLKELQVMKVGNRKPVIRLQPIIADGVESFRDKQS